MSRASSHFRIYRICKILFEKIKIFAILIQQTGRVERKKEVKLKLKCLAGHTRERVAEPDKVAGQTTKFKSFLTTCALSLSLPLSFSALIEQKKTPLLYVHVCSVIVFARNFHKQLCLWENSKKTMREICI